MAPETSFYRKYEARAGLVLQANTRDNREVTITFSDVGLYETTDKAVAWVLEHTFGLRPVKEA